MTNVMKLSTFLIIFLQIQIAFCRPQSIDVVNNDNIQKLCKPNHYQNLCISTLTQDPRSQHSDFQGLASITLDVTSKKVNESLQFLIAELKKISDREEFERYGTCVELYGAGVDRFLPAAMKSFKAKNYSQVISILENVVSAPENCEAQFAGGSTPLAGLNKATHDIADMTSDVIKTFIINY